MPSRFVRIVRPSLLPFVLCIACLVAAIVFSCADNSDCGLLDCTDISSSSSDGDTDTTEEEYADFDRIEHTVTDEFEAEVSADTGGILPVTGCTLTVPAGALEADTVLGVSVYSDAVAGQRSAIYRFSPPGQQFTANVSVAIEYDAENIADPAFFWTLADDLNGFEEIDAKFNDGKAIAEVNHFSLGYVGSRSAADGDEDEMEAEEADETELSEMDGEAELEEIAETEAEELEESAEQEESLEQEMDAEEESVESEASELDEEESVDDENDAEMDEDPNSEIEEEASEQEEQE